MPQRESGPWAGELDGLVGRDEILLSVRELLESGSRTAVVVGIAGSGKTAVLTAAARAYAAEERRVLTLTCQESDRDLPFHVLVDLLHLLPDSESALGMVLADPSRAVGVDPLRLRLEVLALLELAAEAGPVVVVVDDVQWCDDSSVSVLGFVSHRLAGSDIAVLFAARGDAPPAPVRRHPQLVLPPLSEAEATALLRYAGLRVDALTLPSVVERAAGNPLAVLELGRAAILAPGEVLPSDAETAFREQVEALSPATRRALLLAALGDGELAALGRVMGATELVGALAPAEAAGLVVVAERSVRFRHPLVRSAAHALAPVGERLAAHAALAAAYDDAQRAAWHRAEAAIVPDEEVAQALAAASDVAISRGADAEAARFLVRASELSPDPRGRDERLLAAVELTVDLGNFEWAAERGTRLQAETSDPVVRLRAAHVTAYALAQTDRTGAARRALLPVIEELVDVNPDLGLISLSTLAVLTYRAGWDTGEVADWLAAYDRARVGAERTELTEVASAVRAFIRMQVDPLSRPGDIVALVRDAPVPDRPWASGHEMALGAAAWLLDEPAVAIERLGRAIEMMRRAGASGEMTQTLVALGLVQFAVGDYDAAEEAGRLTIDVAESHHEHFALQDACELQARVAGVRGEIDRARELCDRVLKELPAGVLGHEVNVRVTMSRVRLAEHDVQGAWNEIRWIFAEDGAPRHAHISYRELGHYASTAARVGALDELARVVEVAQARMPDPRPYHRLQLSRARALLDPDDAERWYAGVVADPVMAQWPFELANAQLEHGSWLRRRHRRTDARAQLQAAHDTFVRLGTPYWADLARAELRAAGFVTGPQEPSAWFSLTSQEREVVRLAAAGMTNRQIADDLYLSPHTVSSHLYHAFPKLGVTSRAQLRDVVEDR